MPLRVPAKRESTANNSPRDPNVDVALAQLGVETLARLDLFFGELNLPFADRFLQRNQSLIAGLGAGADPHAPDPARTDLEPSEHQLVGHSPHPVGGMSERMGQDRPFDRGRHAVGVPIPAIPTTDSAKPIADFGTCLTTLENGKFIKAAALVDPLGRVQLANRVVWSIHVHETEHLIRVGGARR